MLIFHLQLTDRIQEIVRTNLSWQTYWVGYTTQILRYVKHALGHRTSRFDRNRLGSDFFSVCPITSTAYPESTCNRTQTTDRKSTRLNSSHVAISYAVCCLQQE